MVGIQRVQVLLVRVLLVAALRRVFAPRRDTTRNRFGRASLRGALRSFLAPVRVASRLWCSVLWVQWAQVLLVALVLLIGNGIRSRRTDIELPARAHFHPPSPLRARTCLAGKSATRSRLFCLLRLDEVRPGPARSARRLALLLCLVLLQLDGQLTAARLRSLAWSQASGAASVSRTTSL